MVYKKRKGAKLIHGLVQNWLEDAGEIPDDYDIIIHLLGMEDDEFDTYLKGEPYTQRQELMDEVIEKQKINEEKHPKTKHFRSQQ